MKFGVSNLFLIVLSFNWQWPVPRPAPRAAVKTTNMVNAQNHKKTAMSRVSVRAVSALGLAPCARRETALGSRLAGIAEIETVPYE